MADSKDEDKMEEDWEYYDDSTVLTDFWQKFVDEERDFSRYINHSVIGTQHNFLFRPVDIWLRHFIQPFKNSYGWNLYREFWRVWVPLLLAPRFGQFNIRSKQLPCFMLIGMELVVWTPCQTWRRVG